MSAAPIYQWSPSKADTIGPPLCVHNMEVSVFQGLPVGVVMCAQAGEHYEAAFSDLSVAV